MTHAASDARWRDAQVAESRYWSTVGVGELLRLCAEKGLLIDRLDNDLATSLFDGKDVLEIGVGPLGISLASFYPKKHLIHRLIKIDPLPQTPLLSNLTNKTWAWKYIEWARGLAEEGQYLRMAGEELAISYEFDTVICYNVLDHVGNPRMLVQRAHSSLRSAGRMLLAVDCMSLVGQLRFERLTRVRARRSVLVQAHPHSFRLHQVISLLNEAGFEAILTLDVPGVARRIAGPHFRPVFVAQKS